MWISGGGFGGGDILAEGGYEGDVVSDEDLLSRRHSSIDYIVSSVENSE